MATQKTPTLVELAEKLLEQACELEKVIPAPPTFQEDTLTNLPIEHEKTRLSLIDTSEMFTALVRGSDGPYGRIMRIASYQYLDEVALYAIHHFRIPHRVPLNSSISYVDLADQCQIDVDRLTSLLRMAITFHMFYEPTPGYIAHTTDSRLLVADTSAFDFIGAVRMEHKPATLKVNEALEKWPGSPEPFHAPYSLAHNTDKPMYLHLQQHPVHGAEAYFFANIIHNWSDRYAVRILRALIPALKPGARVLVCDRLIPEPGTVPLVEERELRALDLIMYILFNAKEHTETEMRALFRAADERFEYVDTHAVPHGLFKICEAVWKP